jgi:hypothetical protein
VVRAERRPLSREELLVAHRLQRLAPRQRPRLLGRRGIPPLFPYLSLFLQFLFFRRLFIILPVFLLFSVFIWSNYQFLSEDSFCFAHVFLFFVRNRILSFSFILILFLQFNYILNRLYS